MTKIVDIDHEAGSSRLWNGEGAFGTTMIYGAKGDDSFPAQCDYEIDLMVESRPKQVRAYRESRIKRGQKPATLADDQLHDELFVVVGPMMTPLSAAETLEYLAARIRREGLCIGKDTGGDYITETLDGEWKR
ncbi:MAG: hypothetical protein JHD07_02400 [Bradyrhizobium sp.]|uniref:hypothetical protein n=1 Tax=Bradyrhizobium sp. TaxID=376 RepID=UPI001A21EA63|nr:hypothetical protein [Bradyrhizobium sp.]MBJ7402197.1 hypothetical protein [Bradyrhizobium sp.]